MDGSYLSRLRDHVRKHPMVTGSAAIITTVGTVFHWATDIIDWVSRWDTWDAHSSQMITSARTAAQHLPVWTPEACYAIAILLIWSSVLYRDAKGSSDSALPIDKAPPDSEPSRNYTDHGLQERETRDLEFRRKRAETEAAEERLRQIRSTPQPTVDVYESFAKSSRQWYPKLPNITASMPILRPVYFVASLNHFVLTHQATASDETYTALVIGFRNEAPTLPERVNNVRARLKFDLTNESDYSFTGYWLGTTVNQTYLEPDAASQEVVVAIYDKDYTVRVIDDRRDSSGNGVIDRHIIAGPRINSPETFDVTIVVSSDGRVLIKSAVRITYRPPDISGVLIPPLTEP